MNLVEIGRKYLEGLKTDGDLEEWKRLNQTMIALVQTCDDIEQLREFVALDQSLDYPAFVTLKTLEKLLKLHDFSENTLLRYVTQLSLYWSSYGYEELENYLSAQLDVLHKRHATEAEYVQLGEDIWKRVQEFHKERPDWDEFYLSG